MFGAHRYQCDESLKSEEPSLAKAQLEYAEELLAELLNRASSLYWCGWWPVGQIRDDNPEHVRALEDLYEAVELFLHDCDEARIRARRARLVSPPSHGARAKRVS